VLYLSFVILFQPRFLFNNFCASVLIEKKQLCLLSEIFSHAFQNLGSFCVKWLNEVGNALKIQ